jgi:ParB family transcriptional regulator, chromosome partitioning protein
MTSRKEARNAILGVGLTRAGSVTELTAVNPAAPVFPSVRERVVAGAVGAVSRSLDQFQSDIKAARALATDGAHVVELETAAIENSILNDRLESDEMSQAALIESIRQDGQQVPILVRQLSAAPTRYQVAYGHRRLAACRALGRKVLAVVRVLTDRELLVAQGQENSARRDLSYIERAIFALNLEKRSVDREGIMAALSTDKTELSRLLSLARAVPADIVTAIGPAPKVGRPRWLALAQRLSEVKSDRKFRALLGSSDFTASSSDKRFDLAFAALTPTSRPVQRPQTWTAPDGTQVVRIVQSEGTTTLAIDEAQAPKFGQFVIDNLASLFEAFGNKNSALSVAASE